MNQLLGQPRSSLDRRRRNGRDRSGYLLVEALATLAISAFILVGLASSVGVLMRAGDRAAARAQSMEIVGQTVAALERELRLAAHARWPGQAGRGSLVFAGGPDRIQFVRNVRQPNGLRAPVVIVFQSSATPSGGSVLRAEGPLLPGAAGFEAVELGLPQEIYQGPIAIRFGFFPHTDGRGARSGQASWTDSTALPAAIRIAQVEPTSGALLAESRVPLLIDAEPGCASPQTVLCSRAPSLLQAVDGSANATELDADASAGAANGGSIQ